MPDVRFGEDSTGPVQLALCQLLSSADLVLKLSAGSHWLQETLVHFSLRPAE